MNPNPHSLKITIARVAMGNRDDSVFLTPDQTHKKDAVNSAFFMSYYWLHIRVAWPAAAFWCDPHNVLSGVFNIAGLAVNAVLSVYL